MLQRAHRDLQNILEALQCETQKNIYDFRFFAARSNSVNTIVSNIKNYLKYILKRCSEDIQ